MKHNFQSSFSSASFRIEESLILLMLIYVHTFIFRGIFQTTSKLCNTLESLIYDSVRLLFKYLIFPPVGLIWESC